jgi:hypothetical protein
MYYWISFGTWLQSKVVHFLCCNLIFCKVACISMLLTWHNNNKISNLWLDLDFQLEEENIYKKNCNIYTLNIKYSTFEVEKYGLIYYLCLYIHAFLCMNFIWDIL